MMFSFLSCGTQTLRSSLTGRQSVYSSEQRLQEAVENLLSEHEKRYRVCQHGVKILNLSDSVRL